MGGRSVGETKHEEIKRRPVRQIAFAPFTAGCWHYALCKTCFFQLYLDLLIYIYRTKCQIFCRISRLPFLPLCLYCASAKKQSQNKQDKKPRAGEERVGGGKSICQVSVVETTRYANPTYDTANLIGLCFAPSVVLFRSSCKYVFSGKRSPTHVKRCFQFGGGFNSITLWS